MPTPPHRHGRGARLRLGDAAVAEVAYAPGVRQPRHAHEGTSITLVLAGALREQVGRVDEVARALSVVVKPGGTEHADQFGPLGARTVQIALPGSDAARWAAWDAAARHWRWIHGGDVVRPFLRLVRCLRAAPTGRPASAAPEALATAVDDVLAALALRGAASAGEVAAPGEPPRWLRLAREELDDTATAGARVRDVAGSAGVHPVYLARLFRRHFGCTVSEYLQRRRLQAAAALIADDGAPLSTAAHGAGFADQSHLTRHFRRATGLTPGDFRRLSA